MRKRADNTKYAQRGFVILYAVLVVSIMASITIAMASIAQKRAQLSITGRDSQSAFYAAESGLECAAYWDREESAFSDGEEIKCNGETQTYQENSGVYTFTLELSSGDYCADVELDKTADDLTVVESRGYNTCGSSLRRFQRGVKTSYAPPNKETGSTGTAEWQSIDISIGSGDNDAIELDGGNTVVNGDDLLGEEVGENLVITGLRFPNIPIPKGALISNAYIEFTPASGDQQVDVTARIAAHDAPAPAAKSFKGNNEDISNRKETSASVEWWIPDWNTGESVHLNRTPNVRDVVQELVNRNDWSSGDPIVFIITPIDYEDDSHRRAYSYESGAGDNDQPVLHVVWEE